LIINVQIAGAAAFPAAGDRVENCATVQYQFDPNPNNNRGCVSTVVTSPG
jgi:hypothetical protein